MRKSTYCLFMELFATATLFAYYFPFLPISPIERVVGFLSGVTSLLGLLGIIWRGGNYTIIHYLSSWAREKIVIPLGMLTVLTNERLMKMSMDELIERRKRAKDIVKILLSEEG